MSLCSVYKFAILSIPICIPVHGIWSISLYFSISRFYIKKNNSKNHVSPILYPHDDVVCCRQDQLKEQTQLRIHKEIDLKMFAINTPDI